MTDTQKMRERIAQDLEGVSFDASLYRASINDEINAAIRHYQTTRMSFNEVKNWTVATTVSGQRSYTLTTNFLFFDNLKIKYNDSFITLKERTWDEIDERDVQITPTTGVPNSFAVYANKIRPWPVPNGAYTLVGSYVKSFPEVSLTGSTSTTASRNQTNGWFSQAASLIRHRAMASVRVNFMNDPVALQEMNVLSQLGGNFLSYQERNAYHQITRDAGRYGGSGKVRPHGV